MNLGFMANSLAFYEAGPGSMLMLAVPQTEPEFAP